MNKFILEVVLSGNTKYRLNNEGLLTSHFKILSGDFNLDTINLRKDPYKDLKVVFCAFASGSIKIISNLISRTPSVLKIPGIWCYLLASQKMDAIEHFIRIFPEIITSVDLNSKSVFSILVKIGRMDLVWDLDQIFGSIVTTNYADLAFQAAKSCQMGVFYQLLEMFPIIGILQENLTGKSCWHMIAASGNVQEITKAVQNRPEIKYIISFNGMTIWQEYVCSEFSTIKGIFKLTARFPEFGTNNGGGMCPVYFFRKRNHIMTVDRGTKITVYTDPVTRDSLLIYDQTINDYELLIHGFSETA